MKEIVKLIKMENKEITTEELDLIFKGIRPDGMDYTEFKEYKNLLYKEMKKRLRGQLVFVSSIPELENGKPTGKRLVKTYKSSK